MENRNELSDIVLEKGDNKTVKVKRILILVAFLILIFLVALASMKILK
jgi:DedD protein